MIPTPEQIRLLARYFHPEQITKLCFVTMDEVKAAVEHERWTGRGTQLLIADLERLGRLDQAMEEAKPTEITEEMISRMSRPIDELNLSVRSINCLVRRDPPHLGSYYSLELTYIWEVCKMTEEQLLKTRHFGRKSLRDVKDALYLVSLSLGMDLSKVTDRLPQPPPK